MREAARLGSIALVCAVVVSLSVSYLSGVTTLGLHAAIGMAVGLVIFRVFGR